VKSKASKMHRMASMFDEVYAYAADGARVGEEQRAGVAGATKTRRRRFAVEEREEGVSGGGESVDVPG
jgi:hypothetical protein